MLLLQMQYVCVVQRLIMKDLGFNGITAYQKPGGCTRQIALMDEDTRTLMARYSPQRLTPDYAHKCILMRS